MWSGHADAEARRSVLTALRCATLVTTQVGAGVVAMNNEKALVADYATNKV